MATGNLRATADTPEEIGDIFNNYFTSVFSVPQEDQVDNGAGKFPAAAELSFSDVVLHVGDPRPKQSHWSRRDPGYNPKGNRHYYCSITMQAVQQVSGGRLHTVCVEIGRCSACL